MHLSVQNRTALNQTVLQAALSEQYPDLGINASDIASLGYSSPTNAVQAALNSVFQLSVQPLQGRNSSSMPVLPASPKATSEPQPELEQLNHLQPPAVQTPGNSHPDDSATPTAISSQETPPGTGGPLPAATLARPLQQHCADQVPAAGAGGSWRTWQQANPQAPHRAPAGGSPAIPTAPKLAWAAEAQICIPDDSPASCAWLDELVSRLQARRLCPTQTTMPAALTNHWVVFPLLETFKFTSMGKMLEIGPGLHPGRYCEHRFQTNSYLQMRCRDHIICNSAMSARVVQFIGRNHNWDVCESNCTAAEHAWHFVRAETVHKGAARKFVDLKIDLHPGLRCAKLEGLLCLTKDKLQVDFLCPLCLGSTKLSELD